MVKQGYYFSILLLLASYIHGSAQPNQRIFYSSFIPQDWDIYISKDKGESFEKFTDHPSLDYDAVISPDGKWVVFTSERSGTPKLYIKSVAGDETPALLIKSNSFQDQVSFSPDGSQLAFVASHEGNAEIYIIPFLQDTIQDISAATNVSRDAGGDFRPSFSPDGKKIVFCSDRDHEIVPHPQFPFARQRIGDIFIADVSGNNIKRLTDADSWDGSPVWSNDGTRIIFYSGRTGRNSIFSMNPDGTEQKELFAYSGHAVSPKIISNNTIVFTTWANEQDFKLMQADLVNDKVAPLFPNGPDVMFNPDVHPDGIIVFHGGKNVPGQMPQGRFGFDGDVMAKLPDSLSFADQQVNMYGVRRAFVAPPQPGNSLLYYDSRDIDGFFESLKPGGFGVFGLPFLMIILLITGILSAILNRKIVSFWKYLLFIFFTIVLGILTGGIFLYVDAINPRPVSTIRMVMASLTIVLLIAGWWQYKRTIRKKEAGKETFRISKLYAVLCTGLAVFSMFCAVFINHMVHSTLYFYQVDYTTGKKKLVFTLEKDTDTNPANFSVLDSKVTHDGKSYIITTGSFRGNTSTQGDIWQYTFETKEIKKLADSPYNDGFADISENGLIVFRSGRSGHFDIHLTSDSGTENLTKDAHRDNFPAISKQGDKIVFASDRLTKDDKNKTMDIFMMTRQDDNTWSDPEKISAGQGQNAHPHFSPDGEWVIYTTEGYGINDEQPLIQPFIFSPQMYGEIVAYHIRTKEHVRLTHNKWEDGTPLWVE